MPSSLQLLCRKTQLCRFQGVGRCRKGTSCPFAHSLEEVQSAPDLSNTKLCPVVAEGNICEDTGCSFAHDARELRKLPKRPVRGENAERKAVGPQLPGKGAGPGNKAVQGKPTNSGVPLQLQLKPTHFLKNQDLSRPSQGRKHGEQADELDFSRQSTTDTGEVVGCATPLEEQGNSCFGTVTQLSGQSVLEGDKLSRYRMESSAKGDATPDSSQESAEIDQKERRIFHKTKMCTFNLHGMCTRGRNCSFAHGSDELGPMPNLHCTKLCPRKLRKGKCTKPDCSFAHSEAELRPVSWEEDAGPAGMGARNSMRNPSKEPSDLDVVQMMGLGAASFGSQAPGWGRNLSEDPSRAVINMQRVMADQGSAGWGRHVSADTGATALSVLCGKNTFIRPQETTVQTPEVHGGAGWGRQFSEDTGLAALRMMHELEDSGSPVWGRQRSADSGLAPFCLPFDRFEAKQVGNPNTEAFAEASLNQNQGRTSVKWSAMPDDVFHGLQDLHSPAWGRQTSEDPSLAVMSMERILADTSSANWGRHKSEDFGMPGFSNASFAFKPGNAANPKDAEEPSMAAMENMMRAMEDSCASNWGRYMSEGGQNRNDRKMHAGKPDVSMLSVKNTFFHIESEDEDEKVQPKRRAHSMPASISLPLGDRKTCSPTGPRTAAWSRRSSGAGLEDLGAEKRYTAPASALGLMDPGAPAAPLNRSRRQTPGCEITHLPLQPSRLG